MVPPRRLARPDWDTMPLGPPAPQGWDTIPPRRLGILDQDMALLGLLAPQDWDTVHQIPLAHQDADMVHQTQPIQLMIMVMITAMLIPMTQSPMTYLPHHPTPTARKCNPPIKAPTQHSPATPGNIPRWWEPAYQGRIPPSSASPRMARNMTTPPMAQHPSALHIPKRPLWAERASPLVPVPVPVVVPTRVARPSATRWMLPTVAKRVWSAPIPLPSPNPTVAVSPVLA